MNLINFAGNSGLKKRISQLVDSGRIPNAILLEGENGLGKTTLAKLIANALVCSGEGEKPCSKCRDCRTFASGGHPDIIVITGQGKTSAISVDAVREISMGAEVLPNQAAYRVYILEDAQNMTVQAQNALLKILEEPPGFLVFILTCTSRFELLETILSRTQTFSLEPPTQEEAFQYLSKQIPSVPVDVLQKTIAAWGGNIGKTLEVLQEKGTEGSLSDTVNRVVDCLTKENEYQLMMALSCFEKNKEQFKRFLSLFDLTVRDALVLKSGGRDLISGCQERAKELSAHLTSARLMKILELNRETEKYCYRNIYDSLVLARFCARLWECVR